MSPRIAFRLYAITGRGLVPGGDIPSFLDPLLGAGLRGIQLREKDLPEGELLALAESLRPSMERHGAQWLVNSSLAVAGSARASGVHLPSTGDAGLARARLGASALVGMSVHSVGDAIGAEKGGADFLLFGPVFDTPSKRSYGPPQGIERLREVCESVGVPVFAVGGITPARVQDVLGAGARGVAVISGIMSAENPVEALKEYGRELGGF